MKFDGPGLFAQDLTDSLLQKFNTPSAFFHDCCGLFNDMVADVFFRKGMYDNRQGNGTPFQYFDQIGFFQVYDVRVNYHKVNPVSGVQMLHDISRTFSKKDIVAFQANFTFQQFPDMRVPINDQYVIMPVFYHGHLQLSAGDESPIWFQL